MFNQNNHFDPEDCHEYSITIPKSDVNMFPGETEDDIIESISKTDLAIPDEADIIKQINEEVSKYPLALGVSHVKLSNVGPASGVASEEDDIKKHLVHERKISHIQFYENLICQNLFKLEESKKITSGGLMSFIRKFQLLDDNTLELVKLGITHHFDNDYVASIHILVPQLENVIRLLIKNSNMNVLKAQKDVIMNKQFRGLLEESEVVRLIGTSFSNYLIIKYADIKGINFRNNVSHGLLEMTEFTHANSCALIYAILKLLPKYKKRTDELTKS